jgi:hypothetical protein
VLPLGGELLAVAGHRQQPGDNEQDSHATEDDDVEDHA